MTDPMTDDEASSSAWPSTTDTGRLRELLADTRLLGDGHPVTESLPWTGQTPETLPGWSTERGHVTGSSGRLIASDLASHWPLAELIAEAANVLPDLLAEVDYQRAEVERLRAMVDERDAALEDCEDVVNSRPCPYVATSDGTTSHCTLAEEDGRRWRHLSDDVLRIAAQLHRVGQHPAAIELEERVALHRVPSPEEEASDE